MLDELHSHQQSAVRASFDAEMRRTGDALRDQVTRDGGEVVENSLAVRLEASLVPCGSEFASATDIGQHQRATAFQPQLAGFRRIVRCLRDKESTIGREYRRRIAIELHVDSVNNEVGDSRSVARRGL